MVVLVFISVKGSVYGDKFDLKMFFGSSLKTHLNYDIDLSERRTEL